MLEANYKFGEVHKLAAQITASPEKVQFKPIISTDNGGVVLVAFKAGQQLATHTAPAQLMVTVLEGEIEFTVNNQPHTLRAGEFILVDAGALHSVFAQADAKLMLVKLK